MRDWIALHTGVLDSDTWEDLGDHRLAWIVTLLLAAQQSPEGRFDSGAKLVRLLTKEDVPVPEDAYAAMLEAGCLEDVEGSVAVRGWDRWQRRWRGPSDDPAAQADRKRETYWRDRAAVLEARLQAISDESPTVSGVPPTSADRGEDREEKIERRGEDAGARAESQYPEGERDALDAFYLLTNHRPWGRASGRWIRDLTDAYGLEAVEAALGEEWGVAPRTNDLLSRVDARLGRAAERVREARVAETKRRKPKPAEERTEAEREILGAMIGGQG